MRNLLAVLLVIIALVSCFSIAYAEKEPIVYISGDYDYILLDDGTVEIVDYYGVVKTLTIPSELDGYRVTSIGDKAFFSCESLTEITIPDSVTHVGANSFSYCDNLRRIYVSPKHTTLATIDGVLFDKMEKKLVCYPCAFTEKTYKIPNGIISIGDSAFYRCDSLTGITIPDSVTSIGDSAFGSCDSLTEITIPDSVTHVGANPFGYCDNLRRIYVSPKHTTLATIDGVLFDKMEKKLVCYPCAFTEKTYKIPNGIISIGDSAFSGCESLTEITIPDSVTSIGDDAFWYCKSLTEITIPDSVTSIGDYVFFCCESLTEITIPDSVTSIGDDAFWYCESLTLTVGKDSYAEKYAEENEIRYTYTDSLDWLNS